MEDEENAATETTHMTESLPLPPAVKIPTNAASRLNPRNRRLPGGMTKSQYVLIGLIALTTTGISLGLIFGFNLHQGGTGTTPKEPLDDDYAHLDTSNTELPPLTRHGLPVTLPAFSPSMLNGYEQCHAFKSDLEQAVYHLANVHIDTNARNRYSNVYYNYWIPRGGFGRPMMMMDEEIMTMETAAGSNTKGQEAPSVTESSYGTNNQVEGVEEGDVVTSNGSHVFAAYGDRIVVWDAESGEEVSRTALPVTDSNGVALCTEKEMAKTTDLDSFRCYTHYEWQSLSIVSLLLHETEDGAERLVVVASSPYMLKQHTKGTILSGYHGTRIYMYDATDATQELKLLSQNDVSGTFQAARSIGANAHVVSSSYVSDWNYLASHLSPWNERFINVEEEEEYRTEAYKVALEYAPVFANILFDEIMGESLAIDCSHIAKVVLMVKERARDLEAQEAPENEEVPEVVIDGLDAVAPNMEEVPEVVIDGLDAVAPNMEEIPEVVIDGLDAVAPTNEEVPEVVIDGLDAIAPEDREEDIAVEDSIMPPLTSFNQKGVLSSYVQVTSFKMDAAPPASARLSTSTSGMFVPLASYLAKNIYASAEKLVIAGEAYEEDEEGEWVESTLLFTYDFDEASSTPESIGVVPGSLLNQFSMDHYIAEDGNDYLRVATTTWAKWGYLGEKEGWGQIEESTNQVMVLSMPTKDEDGNASTMEIVGEVTGLGVDERIYACRFIEDKGYLVTFRQTDPFYTLDLSDATNPKMVGELKILGFSNYLHPLEDGDHILAIGQDADANGRTIGLQIALYDVSDFADPKQVQKFVEVNGYSSAEYDHKAFRYLPESELLILPVYSSSEGDYFDGFIVYDVKIGNKFSKLFEISHVSKESLDSCWDMAYLGERSMVFNGKVTTMKGHTILSHDLNTQEQEWKLNLDEALGKSGTKDCGYWRPMFFGF